MGQSRTESAIEQLNKPDPIVPALMPAKRRDAGQDYRNRGNLPRALP
jgi:hypothetical protein